MHGAKPARVSVPSEAEYKLGEAPPRRGAWSTNVEQLRMKKRKWLHTGHRSRAQMGCREIATCYNNMKQQYL